MKTLQLPEAGASITLTVVTPGGYSALLTIRDFSHDVLLEKLTSLEQKMNELGYRIGNNSKTSRNAQSDTVIHTIDKNCPDCGSGLIMISGVYKRGENIGKPYKMVKCEKCGKSGFVKSSINKTNDDQN